MWKLSGGKAFVDDLGTGWEHQRAGRLSEAEACYRRFLASQPNHAEGWAALGVVAFKQQDPDKAIRCYRRSLELKPGSVDVLTNLGVAHAVKRDFATAEQWLRQAIAVRPPFVEAYRNLGHALRDQGKFAEAVQASYQQSEDVTTRRHRCPSKASLGSALHKANREVEAVEPLREALEVASLRLQSSGTDSAKVGNAEKEALLQNGPIRLKRCRHGFMLYLVTDRFIGRSLDRYGEFSEGEAALFRRLVRPGWTILEIGANMGAHTVSLAKMTGPQGAVHAYEPQRVIFQVLCANVALNALSNVYTYRNAVGREAATITVPRIDYATAENFGGVSLGGWPEGECVPVTTVDSMDLPACHMIKVDVEGMEGEVIAGAEQTIRRFQPVLYVENDRQEKSALLIRQLLLMGYRLYWHLPLMFNRDNYFRVSENVFGGTVSVNMLGLHASAPQEITGLREITDPEDNWRSRPGA